MRDARKEIQRAALEDAVDREGQARWDVVMDRIVADNPSRRGLPKQELKAQVRLVVAEVNELSVDEQERMLDDG